MNDLIVERSTRSAAWIRNVKQQQVNDVARFDAVTVFYPFTWLEMNWSILETDADDKRFNLISTCFNS